jgi:hypothetical protein
VRSGGAFVPVLVVLLGLVMLRRVLGLGHFDGDSVVMELAVWSCREVRVPIAVGLPRKSAE